MKKLAIAGLVVFAISVCFLTAIFIVIASTSTSDGTTTARPVAVASPNSIPVASTAPIPLAPPFEEIRAQHDAMTEAQWKNYRTQIEGTMVVGWRGWIDEVTGNPGRYKVRIDMDSPDELSFYPEVGFAVPDDIALSLQIDQQVTFSGQIKLAIDILGALDITLEHAELQ